MYINAWASNTMFKHRINTTQTKFKLNKNAQIKKKTLEMLEMKRELRGIIIFLKAAKCTILATYYQTHT